MNIKKTSQNTFGTTPILKLNLKKLNNNVWQNIPAQCSWLNPIDTFDCKVVNEIGENWNTPNGIINLARNISDFFEEPNSKIKFYCIETLENNKKLIDNIKSVFVLSNPESPDKSTFFIHLIQSSPDILLGAQSPKYKGAGILGVYSAVKLALENGFAKISLGSTNDSFYENIGFSKTGEMHSINIFELPRIKFSEFIDKVERNYAINKKV